MLKVSVELGQYFVFACSGHKSFNYSIITLCLGALTSNRLHRFSQDINQSFKNTCEFNHVWWEYSLNVDITIITFSKKAIKYELKCDSLTKKTKYIFYECVTLKTVITYVQFSGC